MHTPVELMRQKMIAARPPESQSRRKSIMYQVRVSQNSNTKWIYLENKKKIREGFKKKKKKKVGIFPLGFRTPPPPQKWEKIFFFLFDIWCLKNIFVQRNFFFFWLVSLVFGVDAPKIRDPSLNLGVGTPNIGDPSPSAPKIRDPSLNLGVGAK